MAGRRRPLRQRLAAWLSLGFLLVVVAATGAIVLWADRDLVEADPGRLTEPSWPRPVDVPLPVLGDATRDWALDGYAGDPIGDALGGGLAAGDLDGDGDLDLAVAHGAVSIALWEGTRFEPPVEVLDGTAVAVMAGDVDLDGRVDLLVSRRDESDIVLWGGSRIGAAAPESTELPGVGGTSGLLAGELTGDDRLDIVGLGRDAGEPDVLWVADREDPRRFTRTALPGTGSSLAAELVDVDLDGLLDIWITRDVGWDLGADSVLSRRGDPDGSWVDIASEFGAAMEIDGMGITIADLGGDPALDAYLSDLGDNELLVRRGDAYVALDDSGAARIRPPGADRSAISSSWASGAVDVNLDGRLDLVVANGGFPDSSVRNKVRGSSITVDDPPAVLLGVGDDRFAEVWPDLGLEWEGAARGMTIGDVDDDGDDDVVLLTTAGELRALRNDTPGPSVSLRPEAVCPTAGVVVSVAGGDRSFRTLLSRHTYAGSHQPGVIVGTPGPVDVSVVGTDGREWALDGDTDGGRRSFTVACDRADR